MKRESSASGPEGATHVASTATVDLTLREKAYRRQIVAAVWIVVAWVAGTVVFELTAIGGETDYVNFQRGNDTFLGFFQQAGQETAVPPLENTLP